MAQKNAKTQQFVTEDLTGQRFGMLTVLEPTSERYHGSTVWRCRCDCGNIVLRGSSQLKSGCKTNCGCVRVPRIKEDLTGQRFGSLTVIRPTDRRVNRRIVWECRCDCGNTAYVVTQYLKDGSARCCKDCQKKNRPKRDITGMRFGILTALYPTEKRDYNQSVIWHCRCDCGNEVEHSCAELQKENYISCGCLKRAAEIKLKDQTTHVAGTTVEILRNQKVRCDSTTGVTGVNMYRGKYRALIRFQGKTYRLGTYRTLEEAAEVRKDAEECLFGTFLDFYDKWKKKADADQEWAKANPVSVNVQQGEDGRFHVSLSPTLS